MRSINSHRVLAIVLMLSVLGIGALTIVLEVPRSYRAEATIRVTPTYVASISLNSEVRFDTGVEYHDYVRQQIYEIASYETAERALQLLGKKRDLFQMAGESDRRAAERLAKVLDVSAIPDSYFVTIALDGSDPRAITDVVNAVSQAYFFGHSERERDVNSDRSRQLMEQRSRLEGQIHLKSADLDRIAQQLGTSSFDSEAGNPYEKMRADLANALTQANEASIKAKSHLVALEQERTHAEDFASAEDQTGDQTVEATRPADPASNLRNQLESALLEYRGLATNHPGRKALEQKIDDIKAEIRRAGEGALTASIEQAEGKLEETVENEQGLQKQLANLDKEASNYAGEYDSGLVIQADIKRDQKDVQDIDARLNSVMTDAHTPGIVQLESPARIPELPEKSMRRKVGLIIGLLAILLAAGVPTLLDLTDRKVRNVTELQEIVGIPVMGVAQIGNSDCDASRDPLRRLALAILRERRNSSNRVFVLTSAEKGAGTTSLTLALENELRLLGANSVALEANPLSPDSRYRRSQDSSNPKSAPANGGLEAERYTRPLSTSALHRSFLSQIAVARSQGRSEIDPELLQRRLNEQLAKRDIVLLDAAPLLDSADTEILIQIPAATILVVRAERDNVKRVQTATEALARISPPVVGVVLLLPAEDVTDLKPVVNEVVESVGRVEWPRVAAHAELKGDLLAVHKS
jgi:polysaccharide biosynthesis transport protein